MSKVPSIILNNGYFMPGFALGTYASLGDEGYRAVKDAIDIGYRHFDTACLYGNEAEVGKAIKEKIDEGAVKREDIFIVTKLANIHHEKELVIKACKDSARKLGLDYIDLYLMHFPYGFEYHDEDTLRPLDKNGKVLLTDVDYVDTWREMEKCVKLGLVRSIGLSNFNSEQIKRVLEIATVKQVVNQIECSPNINQKKLTKFCTEHGIVITSYCPLGRPNMEKRTPAFLFDERVENIGKKYNKTAAQVILRYIIELGTVPIPKSVTKSRIQQNIDVYNFSLTEDEMIVMDSFHNNERLVDVVEFIDHKYFPFGIEY